MTRRARASVAIVALMCVPHAAWAESPIGGIAVGSPVGAVVSSLGAPTAVTSADTGNKFDFSSASAYADADGIVLAVDTTSGVVRIESDGERKTFAIGTYTLAQADVELTHVAEFASGMLRTYRLSPVRELVLVFDAATNKLARVAYGQPGQLARLGLVPGDAASKAVPYVAPRVRHSAVLPTVAGPLSTVYAVQIDRAGAVTGVAVVIASSAREQDADLARRMTTDRYLPATLGGRPIASTIFVELHH